MAHNILFISHDATRTGAPILLLNLVRALQAAKFDAQYRFLIRDNRLDIITEFQHLAPTFYAFKTSPISRIRKGFNEASIKKALEGVDVVIANTITQGELLTAIRKYFKGKIICYVHELEIAAQTYTTAEAIEQLKQCTDFYFVPSEAVRQFLSEKQKIPLSKVGIMPYYIPLAMQSKDKPRSEFVVGASGTIDWRKGPDLFLQVAIQVFKTDPSATIRFVWKGALPGEALSRLHYEAAMAGLDKHVDFLPADNNMQAFYSDVDVFALTSREDPYPLVVLEAAAYGIPTICFAKAGGAPEFVQDDAGIVVPFQDTYAFAQSVLAYYTNRSKCHDAGKAARLKLQERHANAASIENDFSALLGQTTSSTYNGHAQPKLVV